MTLGGLSIPPAVLRAVQVVVGVGLLAILWRAADGPAALGSLAGVHPLWLVAALLALTLQTVLSALRWRLTAAQLGIVLGPGEAVREYYLSQIVNQSLPGGMVGDAGRAVRTRRHAGLLTSGQAVVFERLAGQIAMFATVASAFLITWALPGGIDWPPALALFVMMLMLAGLVLPVALMLSTRIPGKVGRKLSGLKRALALSLWAPDVLPRQIVLSLGTTACNLSAFAFCARAVDAPLAPVAVIALVPLILFTMLIPISVSGWGLREGAAAALFPVAGATASDGLATSVAFGLIFAVSVLPGVVPLWLRPSARAVKY